MTTLKFAFAKPSDNASGFIFGQGRKSENTIPLSDQTGRKIAAFPRAWSSQRTHRNTSSGSSKATTAQVFSFTPRDWADDRGRTAAEKEVLVDQSGLTPYRESGRTSGEDSDDTDSSSSDASSDINGDEVAEVLAKQVRAMYKTPGAAISTNPTPQPTSSLPSSEEDSRYAILAKATRGLPAMPLSSSSTTSALSASSTSASSARSASPTCSTPEPDSEELALLSIDDIPSEIPHEVLTAPLITRDAYLLGNGLSTAVPQYGVLGSIISIRANDKVETHKDPRMYLNTNAPFSAVVCGVQGSGKSHTVGVFLESMLIANDHRLGSLPKPLAGLVLHIGESGGSAQPCEAAYQCQAKDSKIKPPKVKVFVSPSQLKTMQKVYSNVFGGNVQVAPLKISHAELDSKSILSMMSVSTASEPPLYVQIILNILRSLGENFSWKSFKAQLDKESENFNPQQKSGFEQRFSLLESFLEESCSLKRFEAGQLTVIDLTDPFIDPGSACSLFEIVTRIFMRADIGASKVLVVDEAHKYLKRDRNSKVLTETLLSIVRQQRHLGCRLILSTQEPTVIPPALLDLCSITIMHRFASISWFKHLSQHVSSEFGDDAFDMVVKLQTGQAIVMAPAGLAVLERSGPDGALVRELANLGRRYVLLKTRRRVTADGGASILAV